MKNCPDSGLVADIRIVMARMVEAHMVEAHMVEARMVLGLELLGLQVCKGGAWGMFDVGALLLNLQGHEYQGQPCLTDNHP